MIFYGFWEIVKPVAASHHVRNFPKNHKPVDSDPHTMLSIFSLHVCGNLACVRTRHARYVACGIPEYENFREFVYTSLLFNPACEIET